MTTNRIRKNKMINSKVGYRIVLWNLHFAQLYFFNSLLLSCCQMHQTGKKNFLASWRYGWNKSQISVTRLSGYGVRQRTHYSTLTYLYTLFIWCYLLGYIHISFSFKIYTKYLIFECTSVTSHILRYTYILLVTPTAHATFVFSCETPCFR